MKNIYLFLIFACLSFRTFAQAPVTFSYTGSEQSYAIPSGVTQVSVDAIGGGGGYPYWQCGNTVSYAPAGRVQCTLNVTPGTVLYLYVGGKGGSASCSSGPVQTGGYNGGKNGTSYSGASGGASDVRLTQSTGVSGHDVLPYTTTNRVVVAGGGGGGADYYGTGGAGGGLTGGTGIVNATYGGTGGTGGTQTSGGTNGNSGSIGSGASVYNYGTGGGGYYGGGSGTGTAGGGGGGSSYTDPVLCSAVIHTQGYSAATGDGQITITPLCGAGLITGTPAACLGATTQLTDVTTGTGWAWYSSNPTVATVDASGLVSGVALGTALISYGGFLTCGTVYATKLITVTPIPTSVDGGPICQSFTAAFTASSSVGTWSTSDGGLATINSAGVATGIAPGTPTITYAISPTCYATAQTTVNPTSPISGPATVCNTTTITLSDAVTGGTWTSSNVLLATVDPSSGVVTGVAAGNPTISYTLPTGCVRTYPITVYPLPAIFSGSNTSCTGLNTILIETSTGGTWSSSNSAIASVGSISATTAGVLAKSTGTAIISYKLPTGCFMTTPFTVNPLPADIAAPFGICVTDALNPAVTLSDATTGGTWSTSNGNAGIGASSGVISGIATGTTTVTYTLTLTGCIATQNVYINPIPAAITGTQLVCQNAVTYLNDPTIGGTWASTNMAVATVGSGTGIVTGTGAGTAAISYTSNLGCVVNTTVSVNPAPAAIGGPNAVCENGAITLTDTDAPGTGTWSSSSTANATIDAASGVVTGMAAGSSVITYTLPVTGCIGTTVLAVNPVPAAITPLDPAVCYGQDITLNNTSAGGTWGSSNTSVATITPAGGVLSPATAGSAPVTAVVSYSYVTGCSALITVTVNPLPTVYNLVASATSYCSGGAGVDLTLVSATAGITYDLYNGGLQGSFTSASSSAVTFAHQTIAGTYSVIATNKNTGCSASMTGNPTVSIDSLPAVEVVSTVGSGEYCTGATGAHISIAASEASATYYVKNVATGMDSVVTMAGNGGMLDLGVYTNGTYTVHATNTATGCTSNMSGVANVIENALPAVYNISVEDSGHYCANGAGVHISLDGGAAGIQYTLSNTTSIVAVQNGANTPLDFTGTYTTGTYTAVAENMLTHCTSNMNGSVSISTLPLPRLDTVTGTGGYCPGGAGVPVAINSSVPGISYQLLRGSTTVGSSVAGTGARIDFGAQVIGGSYTVVATNINTGCAQAMYSSANVTAYPGLKIDTVTLSNNGNYCVGGAGVDVMLSGSDTGVIYNVWKNNVLSSMVPVIGTGGPVTFPAKDGLAGITTVVATSLSAGGCQATMQGSPIVVINSLPVQQDVTVTNGGFYCAGGTGVNIGLNFSETGISYELFMGSVTTGRILAGANSGLDFGAVLPAGTYNIIATDNTTLCSSNMSESVDVTINPLPVAYNITGGGSYCIGTTTGKQVGLYSSQSSISYQLFNGATQSGSAVTGTGSAVDFGYQLATGLYTVYGTNTVTGCINKMTGSTVITKDSLPAQFAITGGGDYCAGGAGVHVGLSNSVTGINYQLYSSAGVSAGVAMAGSTGHTIDFGAQTIGGTYSVIGTIAASSCVNNMSGSAVVTVNALPAADTLLGGGTACAGSAGVAVYMAHTVPGINYQLYNAGAPVGAAAPGTGSSLALGSQTTGGAYTVIAQNPATGCENTMTGTAMVTINPLPLAYTTTGGGTMCAGGTGFTVALGGSQPGVSYTLSGAAIPVTLAGTGAALDFGRQTSAGIYTIQASDIITGCANTMTGTATVNVNPAPAPFAISGGGNYCIGGAGVLVGLGGSESGINYQLYNGTVATGTPVGGTGSSISFGRQTAAGTAYTVRAVNTTSTCGSDMTGSVPVIIDTLGIPTVKINNSDSSCIGAVEHYTVTSTFTGTAPIYLWKVGGTVVSASSTYDVIPANGDVVSVELTSNAACIATTKAKDALTVSAIPYSTPTAAITATPGDNVCHGTAVTVSAVTTFGGSLSAGSWLRNGVHEGTGTTFSYTPNSGNTGDVITYLLHSNYRCRSADSVYSNAVVMTVDTAVMPVFDLTAHTGPLQSIGTSDQTVGQIDTFTAGVTSSSAYTYAYQWYIQGTPVPGATNNVYIDHSVYNNDEISCEVTKTGTCGSQSATKKITVKLKNVGVQQVLATTSDISILPNPNKGSFIVKGTLGSNAGEEATLELTNILGQVVYTMKVNVQGGSINEQVQVNSVFANGMYLLNVRAAGTTNVFHVVIEQ